MKGKGRGTRLMIKQEVKAQPGTSVQQARCYRRGGGREGEKGDKEGAGGKRIQA